MKQGSLSLRYLKNSVLKYIKKNDKNLVAGVGVGNDFSQVANFCKGDNSYFVTSDGYGSSPLIAWNKAMNNFLCSMGNCQYARILCSLPVGIKDSHIKNFMEEFQILADKENVQIIGGNTNVDTRVNAPIFSVTLFGTTDYDWSKKRKNIETEYDIVFTGYAGILGTDMFVLENREILASRFSESFMDSVLFDSEDYSVKKSIEVAKELQGSRETDICYVHDVSDRGIYMSLWQLGESIHKGILIQNRMINIKQGTIEVCECLDKNPYLIDGTGGLLLVCKNGRKLVEKLNDNNITASLIGKVTGDKEKRVYISENDIRTLSPEE